jgi:hypothetical protein
MGRDEPDKGQLYKKGKETCEKKAEPVGAMLWLDNVRSHFRLAEWMTGPFLSAWRRSADKKGRRGFFL